MVSRHDAAPGEETSLIPASLSLEISGADIQQQDIPILAGSTIIGRAPTSTIQLSHPTVSRRHAEIRSDNSGVQIADLGSANGTWMNKTELPVKEWHPLTTGEIIEIGPFHLRLKEREAGTGLATEIVQTGPVGGAKPATETFQTGTVVVSPA